MEHQGRALYATVARKARLPVLFERFAVATDFEARFEARVYFLHALLRRLSKLELETNRRQALAYFLEHEFFKVLRETLLERSVSHASVGQIMKKLAKAAWGRGKAYREALNSADPKEAVEEALLRNLYSGKVPEEEQHKAFSRECLAFEKRLDGLSDDIISKQGLDAEPFPPSESRDE